ncbi:MAG: elongation factor P [Bacteroidetes bacterium RIFCSPLOWO2_02_FULL_36_8]|nr:MAG: elongation factor P [Bacteroidetes bacterium RIFCSPLOWO2_02_FULL_36_8]OFY68904.1 MAG: elongation factor P [Bacteroidetes bacterium RIFCSPLOWO2_12_FULL_37_12]
MATTQDIKNGLCIEFNNILYSIVDFQHVKPGKGPAFVRTKLKNIKTGKVIDNTFDSGVRIKTARIERKRFQFLYKDDLGYHLMDMNDFEEIFINKEMIENYDLLKEGQEVELLFHSETDTPLLCEIPQFVELKVTYTEPGYRGDTATASFKPATLETGAVIQVPLFVENQQALKIDTRTRSYVERVG